MSNAQCSSRFDFRDSPNNSSFTLRQLLNLLHKQADDNHSTSKATSILQAVMSHMINPLATPEQLYQRRSFSALPTELQDAIFFSTQCLTQAAGLLLQLPQSVTAQANVLLARYWLVEPMMFHEFSVSPLHGPSHNSLLQAKVASPRTTN